ncbi:phosphoribosylanthranilate isomerase [Leeuwenhoekiella aestuarii]|uniref:N-(5'-phosphoribosyl)anthranilate isomerase n=1 Tax=Leeuwenhoekiella aestuarii TaxID=2249426 RepID=A0A4Q0NR04_9FLAO|nr:phosphoribosylanthranilate isomerase [Leeuwenhoekiella aestuarii]
MKDQDTTKDQPSATLKPAALQLKICGMKYNTAEVAQLQPDYLGFIFYEKSPRNYDLSEIPSITLGIKKVGVFVNADLNFVLEKIDQFNFDVIQLHGNESPEYCEELNHKLDKKLIDKEYGSRIDIWKVFSIKDTFDFSIVEDYEAVVDKFLFDTKGKEKGGNGYTFDWSVLNDYKAQKPFILSGGIGLEELAAVQELQKTDLPLYAIDVNSKFEDRPGLKNIENLNKLMGSFEPIKRAE